MFNIVKATRSNTWVVIAVSILGLLVHGPQAGRLGLYWEEGETFLKALLDVDGDVVKFVLKDVGNFLSSERPLGYLSFMLFRAGFAMSLSLAHWVSVVLLVLTAALLATLARRIVDEDWFSFTVGVVFLTYPLSPLQAIWMATGFYMCAAILALSSMLLFLRALEVETGQGRWLLFAGVAYLASIVTHEGFILIPPTFVVVQLLLRSGHKDFAWNRLAAASVRRLAVYGLGLCLIPMTVYGFWREVALPGYGGQWYPTSGIAQTLGDLGGRLLVGVRTVFMPLEDALMQITHEFQPAPTYLLLSGILSLAVWAIILSLRRSETGQEDSPEKPWWHAAVFGAAFAASGIVFIALVPVHIGGVVGTGWSSRVNFFMVLGVALAVPGFLCLVVSPYSRLTLVAGLFGMSFLIYVAFTSSFLGVDELFGPANFTVIGEYSVKHRLVMVSGATLIAVLTLVIILASVLQLRRSKHLPTDRLGALYFRLCSHFLAGTVAGLVFLGSLFHFSVKEQYIAKWDEHKSMLRQLRGVAPALKPDTFVVVMRAGYDPVAPSEHEMTSYLRGLYNDESIGGVILFNKDSSGRNVVSQPRFHPDGVDLTYNGRIRRYGISYDRLLIFDFDDRNLRMLGEVQVKTDEGLPILVRNNPDRILNNRSPVKTAVWRYIAE
jgi:hypothetical protein